MLGVTKKVVSFQKVFLEAAHWIPLLCLHSGKPSNVSVVKWSVCVTPREGKTSCLRPTCSHWGNLLTCLRCWTNWRTWSVALRTTTPPTKGSEEQTRQMVAECVCRSPVNDPCLLCLQGSSILEKDGRPSVHPGVPEPLDVFSQSQQDHSGRCADCRLGSRHVWKCVTALDCVDSRLPFGTNGRLFHARLFYHCAFAKSPKRAFNQKVATNV